MNIYSQKQRWKWVLFLVAIIIVFTSLWYTNNLVKRIADDERVKVKLWADAVQRKAKLVKFTNDLFLKLQNEERKKAELYASATQQLNADLVDITFVLKVLQDNTTVPVILTDELLNVTASRNLDTAITNDSDAMKKELEVMRQTYPPVVIDYYKGKKNYLFFKDSRLFNDIKVVFDNLIKSFITEVAVNSAAVPVIYTDSTKHNVIAAGNLDSLKYNTQQALSQTLALMELQNTPIKINLGEGAATNYIFYEQSPLLTQLKYYPYIQFGVIGLFLLIAYVLFSTARKAEQDQVWVGMSKETAHQLGTPLSSLMAWTDYLKENGTDENIVTEMNRDLMRLNTITDRFSKIGSQPTLHNENICVVVKNAIDYLKTRTSKNVNYTVTIPDTEIHVMLSTPLFEWVIENICKNAVDAMDGKGAFSVTIKQVPEGVIIDLMDTGKGVSKKNYKEIFKPGYTTKKRGWGLGLSLCKRIIENYHNGKIYILESEENKGTTFRILLKSH